MQHIFLFRTKSNFPFFRRENREIICLSTFSLCVCFSLSSTFFSYSSNVIATLAPFKDPEYKLKSANQTPTALNNALTNSHEISRNIMDERKAYIKGVSCKWFLWFFNIAQAVPGFSLGHKPFRHFSWWLWPSVRKCQNHLTI